MSIMSNQLVHVPRLEENGHEFYDSGCGWHLSELSAPPKISSTRRRFFQSAARWDNVMQRVLVRNDGLAMPRVSVADAMEAGGIHGDHDGSDPDEDMDVDDEEGET